SHIASLQRNKISKQQLLTNLSSKNDSYSQDMCSAFIRADIPLSKLNCDAFRQFLEKYTGKKTPNESTLRKTYLPDAFNDIMKRIALELKGKYFYIVVDETTDS
ncbi:hypothetical protein ILUMI_15138, partial [Ignelater luminosus]